MPKRKKVEEEFEDELAAEEAEEDALERAALAMGRDEKEERKSVRNKGVMSDASGLDRATALAWNSSLTSSADELPWVEHLVLSSDLDISSSMDDLEREVAIYKSTLSSVLEGRSRLESNGEPFLRPKDFFCEMMKSDGHMAKVKDELIFQQKKMEAFEKRKERQQQLKFAKAIQAEKHQQKIQRKKEAVKHIENFRKQGASQHADILSGGKDSTQDPFSAAAGNATTKRKKNTISRKRQALDKKWGFGGKKRGQKRNDAKSINDLSAFRPTRGKSTAKKGGGAATMSPKHTKDTSSSSSKRRRAF